MACWCRYDAIGYRLAFVFRFNSFAGQDYELLTNEIASIQELLDEQPDSKCTVTFAALVY